MPVLAYCFTLNNYSADDVATLRNGRSEINYLIGGHEVAETGTPHIQGYLQLSKQVKLPTLKNWGGPFAKMHMSPANGESEPFAYELDGEHWELLKTKPKDMPYSATGYCMKEGNFFEVGERRMMGRKGRRNDLESVQIAIDRGDSMKEIRQFAFGTCARYTPWIDRCIREQKNDAAKEELKTEYEGVIWKPWQQQLITMAEGPVDRRKITWVWEAKGHVGKSWVATYMGLFMGASVYESAKVADLSCAYVKDFSPIVCIDIVRCKQDDEYLTGMYGFCEALKNGRIFVSKFNSADAWFKRPHVIVFSNAPPDYKKWSEDRFDVIDLNERSYTP